MIVKPIDSRSSSPGLRRFGQSCKKGSCASSAFQIRIGRAIEQFEAEVHGKFVMVSGGYPPRRATLVVPTRGIGGVICSSDFLHPLPDQREGMQVD